MSESAHPDSWYHATARELDEHAPLTGEQECDVCVVGGGFTGLSAALHLAEHGYAVRLLEARRIGWGASGRNGGQLGSGMRLGQEELEQRYGPDEARHYWELAEESKQIIVDRVARHGIDCDLKPGIAHVLHRARFARDARATAAHLRERYGYEKIRFAEQDEIRELLGSDAFFGGTVDTGAWHLHPLNLCLGLARACREAGVVVHEHSEVLGYDGSPARVTCAGGSVRAAHVVLGLNGYLGRLEPRLAGRIMPINNFILATEPLGARAREINRDDIAAASSRFVVDYWHNSPDGRLLFGGGESYTRRLPRDLKAFVRRPMLRVYPQLADARIDYAWAGTVGITMSRLPHVGRLDGNVWFGQGFSGHGVGTATLVGKLLAEAIDGEDRAFRAHDPPAPVAVPRRPPAALARPGGGHVVVRHARPVLSRARVSFRPPAPSTLPRSRRRTAPRR